jgi:ferritin
MLRLYHYLSEVDGHALTPGIKQPPHEFDSVQSMFQQVYEHEQKVTRSISNLMDVAQKENDHASISFLQWYIDEQREEENLMRTILDKIRLIGNGPQSLYYIDKEVQAINAEELKAEGE